MTLQYKKTGNTTELLNDLIKINDDRIACYQRAINETTHLDTDLKDLFSEIIKEGNQYRQQLLEKIEELNGNPKNRITISGLIHRAWQDLKVTFIGNTRSAIVGFCSYNEEIAQQSYKAALTMYPKISKDIKTLIEFQQYGLKRTFEAIKKCYEARNYLRRELMYFN
jgi:uncharacterized protein (TIGR02284 family)